MDAAFAQSKAKTHSNSNLSRLFGDV